MMPTQQKIYMMIAVFSTVVLALAVGLAYPLFTGIKKDAEAVLEQKDKIGNVELQNKALDDFREQHESRQPNFDKIDALFVDAKDPIAFITFLEKTASLSKITIDITFSSAEEGGADEWPVALFQIMAKGGFANALDFARKVETAPYLTVIKKINMHPLPEATTGAKNIPGKVEAVFLVEVITK